MPSYSDFIDVYQGQWDSFAEFAQSLADDIDLLRGVPEHIAGYFNWDAWARDLRFDYSVLDAPEGGVHVMRDL